MRLSEMMSAIGEVVTLESLIIELQLLSASSVSHQLSPHPLDDLFSPLSSLTRLHTFVWRRPWRKPDSTLELSSSHFDVLCRLPLLTHLGSLPPNLFDPYLSTSSSSETHSGFNRPRPLSAFSPFDCTLRAGEVARLLISVQGTGMPSQLQYLNLSDMSWRDSLPTARLGDLLPVLRSFSPSTIQAVDTSFIGRLTQVEEVNLFPLLTVDVTLLVAALSQLTQLRRLVLWISDHQLLNETHLTQLLPHLAKLEWLTLVLLSALTSLSFLSSTPHLAHTLRSLEISCCHTLHPSELRHVRSLTSLTELRINSTTFTSSLNQVRFNPFIRWRAESAIVLDAYHDLRSRPSLSFYLTPWRPRIPHVSCRGILSGIALILLLLALFLLVQWVDR